MKQPISNIVRPARSAGIRFITSSLCLAVMALMTTWGMAQFTFVQVADTTTASPSDGSSFKSFGAPAFSGGTAAFLGMYNGFPNQGIFAGDGNALTAVADTTSSVAPDGTLFNAFGAPSISGNGTAFWGLYRGFANHGIFINSAGTLTTIAKLNDPAPVGRFEFLLPDVANSGGVVAFSAWYGGFEHVGVFTGNGGLLTTIAETGDAAPIDVFWDLSSPSISGDTAAFVGYYWADQGIFTGNGGPLTTIVKTGDAAPVGAFTSFVATNPPSISGDTVAFVAYYGAEHGIFTGNGGSLTTIARTGDTAPVGPFHTLVGPSISGDTVAFTGFYGSAHGIFTGNGGELTAVIKTGDPLFESTVTSVFLNRFGLDDGGSGSLAFAFSLADGRTGVAIATKDETPECPCETWSVSSFESPMGSGRTLRSTLPIKFELFFNGARVSTQEQLDQILADNGCPPASPTLAVYESTGESVSAVEGIEPNVDATHEDNAFRPVDGKWIYILRLDPYTFSRGKTYLAEVSIGNCSFVGQENSLFQVK